MTPVVGLGIVVFGITFPLVLLGTLFVTWIISYRVRRYFQRSLKAQQDLARSVSDLADRLERLERREGASGGPANP